MESNDAIFLISICVSFGVLFVGCYYLIMRYEHEPMRREKHEWANGYADAKLYHMERGRYTGVPFSGMSQAYINGWTDYMDTYSFINKPE